MPTRWKPLNNYTDAPIPEWPKRMGCLSWITYKIAEFCFLVLVFLGAFEVIKLIAERNYEALVPILLFSAGGAVFGIVMSNS